MAEVIIAPSFPDNRKGGSPMARPRKALPSDPFRDLSKKTEILEREMTAQRAALERLKQIGTRATPLRAGAAADTPTTKRRAAR